MDSASDPKTSTHMQPRTPRKSVSWFRRIADIVLVLAIIGFVAFNWVQIRHFFDNFVETVQPCQHPITYSIGTFDTRFGLTEDEFKQAITDHEAIVGMNHEMVLAALGRPEHKVRERDPDGTETEDWIYGTPPARTTFVTFTGDKVIRVKEFD